MYTCDESFSDRRPVRLLFKHESARQLRLEFLKVVVTIVAHLVSDPNDHQLKLVDLADWLWGNCLLLLHDGSLSCQSGRSLGRLWLFLGHFAGLNLSFYHTFFYLRVRFVVF